MQKRAIINRVYKAVANTKATSKVYRDTDWSGVNGLINDIESVLPAEWPMTLDGTEYKGTMGECGHRKVYYYTITDTEHGKDISAMIIASFCGTLADPMGAYDLTLLLN